jgi:hypothetical protein
MAMANPINLPLCEFDDALGRQSLSAVIDELTLTYSVVDRERQPLRKAPAVAAGRAALGSRLPG